MWNDIETTTDYLHFSVVSKTVADLIIESGDNPISIGISGSWGAGKSSMVKMIGKDLNDQSSDNKYIFLEFNAWLYQGYEDAKSALLQSVTMKLTEEMKKQGIDEDGELGKKFKKSIAHKGFLNFAISRFQFHLARLYGHYRIAVMSKKSKRAAVNIRHGKALRLAVIKHLVGRYNFYLEGIHYFISSAFLRTSSIVPALKNACSGISSTSPLIIALKPLTVSLTGT